MGVDEPRRHHGVGTRHRKRSARRNRGAVTPHTRDFARPTKLDQHLARPIAHEVAEDIGLKQRMGRRLGVAHDITDLTLRRCVERVRTVDFLRLHQVDIGIGVGIRVGVAICVGVGFVGHGVRVRVRVRLVAAAGCQQEEQQAYPSHPHLSTCPPRVSRSDQGERRTPSMSPNRHRRSQMRRSFICTSPDQWLSNARTQVDR